MLAPKTHTKWKELVQGQIPIQMRFLPFNVIAKTMSIQCRVDPSPQNLDACVNRLYEFALKYESALSDDLKKIFG